MNKPKTTMEYFEHSTNLSKSIEISKLRVRSRNDFPIAYSLYFMILEDLSIDINSKELTIDDDYILQASDFLYTDEETIKKCLDLLCNLNILKCISKLYEVPYIITDSEIIATKEKVLNRRKGTSERMSNLRNNVTDNNDIVTRHNANVLLKRIEENSIEENSIEENNKVIVIQEESGTTTTTTTNDLISRIDSFGMNLNDNHRQTITSWINSNSQAVYDMILKIENSGKAVKNSVNFNYIVKTYQECLKPKNIQNSQNLIGNTANLETTAESISEEEQEIELQRLKEERKKKKQQAEEAKQSYLERKNRKNKIEDNEIESDIIAIC